MNPRLATATYPIELTYNWLILARNSLLVVVLASRSMSSSMASTGESGFSTLRSTQMRVQVFLRDQQLFLTRAGALNVDGREGALVDQLAVENDFRCCPCL